MAARPEDPRESYLLLRARLVRELGRFLAPAEAAQEARMWLELGLGMPRHELARRGTEVVPAAHLRRVRGWMRRREQGEPFLQMLGWAPFCGRRFRITPEVMIPRSHSEAAARAALAWGRELGVRACVDVGTGCGNLAVTLALESPWRLAATELSPAALRVARANARALGARVAFAQGSLLEPLREPLDFVVANLPYVDPSRACGIADALAFEPPVALVSPGSGTDLNARLLEQAWGKGARACLLEHGPGQGAALAEAARKAGWPELRVAQDSLGEDHLLHVWR